MDLSMLVKCWKVKCPVINSTRVFIQQKYLYNHKLMDKTLVLKNIQLTGNVQPIKTFNYIKHPTIKNIKPTLCKIP